MKYFAILKDSAREALDSKIIFVMFGLSVLVILVVATMSFRPASPDHLLRMLASGHLDGPGGMRFRPRQGLEDSHVELRKVETLKGEANSPDAELRVSFVLFAHGEEARKELEKRDSLLAFLKARFARFEGLGIIKVAAIRLPEPADAPFVRHDQPFDVDLQPAAGTRRFWPHQVSLFFGAVPLGDPAPLGMVLFMIGSVVLRGGAWVAILIGVVITASFIPNMLRKGTVDLLLVKPIHRWALLFYKYLGGLTFIFLNTALAVGGIWLALGLRSGVWANGFLLMIFGITFYFAILYAVSVLFGVWSQSPVVSILMTCLAWGLFFLVGMLYHLFEEERRITEEIRAHNPGHVSRREENVFHAIVRAVYPVVPRTADLTILMQNLVYRDFFSQRVAEAAPLLGSEIHWVESLGVSCAFIAAILGLSCWWFATRDY